MDRNQVKGIAKEIAGQVQEKAGKLLGNKSLQTKGLIRQVAGKAEKELGGVREILNNSVHKH
ncbi:CsbD family protein [Jeongeupia naejangsanensis]|uniref:CsbD family protein n=1 Tax=Jeongeupia naejangsanensis TaxID=613195 RepID=A0ABS2BQY4_9NEIS|nr:CsbD family protein [Jeongeupia naejangsanensis]MBM3117850.1 CsbD family protein [Jeongeupia naejangsanensis]